jgi:hypothetical protein
MFESFTRRDFVVLLAGLVFAAVVTVWITMVLLHKFVLEPDSKLLNAPAQTSTRN